jgi:hypothetical protein
VALVVPLDDLSLQGLMGASLRASPRMMALSLRSGFAHHSRSASEMDRSRLVELLTDALAVVAEQQDESSQ